MSIIGVWDVRIKTPVGSLHVVYHFDVVDGRLTGSASSKQETVPCNDIVVSQDEGGQRVTWRQKVGKPMRLNLEFDVLVDGDRLSGHSRAGRLPRSTVDGSRRA